LSERWSALIGFVVASAIPPVVLSALAVISESRVGVGRLTEELLLFSVSFLVFFPYSVIFTAAIGVPSFLFLRRLALITWWTTAAVGVVAGILVSAAVRSGNQSYIDALIKFVPSATVAALAFWGIWKQLRQQPARPKGSPNG